MKKKFSLILIIAILLIAAFLRLYRIGDYMTFLGDEGRDVLVAKDILSGHLTLLGPRASAGDFFLGPIYYYMIAPFLWLFKLDPVGPSIMVALLSVVTTFLIYLIGKKFFDERAGLFAAALYAVSPLVITYSHSSWNPNVLPFFSLLIIYFAYKSIQSSVSWKHFLLIGILLGVALQLHYLALFLGVIVFLFIFLGRWQKERKIIIWQVIKNYLQIFVGFLIGFSPFLLFEARHGFPNIKTIFGFIAKDTTSHTYETHASFFSTIADVFYRMFAHLVFHSQYLEKTLKIPSLTIIYAVVIIIISIAAIVNLYFAKNKFVVVLLYLWLFIGIFLFGLYKKAIYDYYFAFAFPLPFLIIGNFLSTISSLGKRKAIGISISLILFTAIFALNLYDTPIRYEPNRQKNQIKTIVELIISKTDNKQFNFAQLAGGNSDHAYRYYFDILNHPAVRIETPANDPKRATVTSQLMIICEQVPCSPLGHPLFDIAAFGRAQIAGEWSTYGMKVYKLTHYK